jgi:hypothetical protein
MEAYMNKLLKVKITLAMLRYSTNDMLFIKGLINNAEHKAKSQQIINDLYEVIASMEPKHESEII